ncbi:hypothetical protein CON48_13830 [Bacillus thuringiensis]|uniref:Uncharacterized protein n=1 Tax=Bacillus thuringiensis TaxID=1428 RepID=A0A9X6TJK3_BACTU|nr:MULTISPECIES: hypothetical protein [Bacillus cereus group]MCU4819507.1 hypothetical protein [Bacillus cereus]MCU5087387.1 hypothetical protein [Bacillus cereus]MCU5103237.1 hypothetical protein [Bacillus cereus]MCU5120688.1 hypothetical protein [Bacillus cereus]MCU5634587.1 hypothetical protein [Bacillus cereus]
MREAIEEYIEQLQLSAVENRKRADKAYDDEDLGLAGYYKGQWSANEETAVKLTVILSKYKEEEQ